MLSLVVALSNFISLAIPEFVTTSWLGLIVDPYSSTKPTLVFLNVGETHVPYWVLTLTGLVSPLRADHLEVPMQCY